MVVVLFAGTTAWNLAEDRFLRPTEGSLLLDSATGVVYRYEAGHKRAIENGKTMRCLRGPGQHLIRYRTLDEIPDGPPIENRTGCESLPPAGYLIQPSDTTDVYLSTGASLRLVPNQRTLTCLRSLHPVEVVAPEYLADLPIGPPVPDGENCR